MKEHILAAMINDLRDIAIKYHDHECLRENIRTRVLQGLHDDTQWYRDIKTQKSTSMVELMNTPMTNFNR